MAIIHVNLSRHLQLRIGGLCWCQVLLPICDGNLRIRIREKTLEFSTVLSTLSPYCKLTSKCKLNTHNRLTAFGPGLPG